MGHYRANLRDLEFNLFEVLGLDSVLDSGAYGDLDTATVRDILGEVARLSEGPIADSFVASSASETSLKFSSMSQIRSEASLMSSK